MTAFRHVCRCFCLLVLGLLLFAQLGSAADTVASTATVIQLQQENAALHRQVRRLESQSAALREELNSPGSAQIIGGIGYIVGLFGIAGWFAARNKSRQE